MLDPKIVVPFSVLILQIIVKIVVGKSFEKKNIVDVILELPNNLIFIAFSFTLVCLFSDVFLKNDLLVQLLIIFVVILVIFALHVWSKNINYASKSALNIILIVVILIINYTSSGFLLFTSTTNVLSINKTTEQVIVSDTTKILVNQSNIKN